MKNKIIEGYLKNFIEDNGNFGENSEDIIFEHLINYLIVKKYYLDDFNIEDVSVNIVDKGALNYTIKARLKTALKRLGESVA